MKGKPSLLFGVCFVFLLSTILVSCAFASTQKAKEFMQAGMYPQAIALLEKTINEKPTNAEAHFLMGICQIYQGNFSAADDRFASAMRLRPDYGYEIGEEYKKAGIESLKGGKGQQSLASFDKAIQYQPNLKNSIANELFEKGKLEIDGGNPEQFFSLAAKYDPGLKDAICEAYYKKGKSADKTKASQYLLTAIKYCSKHNNEIAIQLLQLANSIGDEKERKNYLTKINIKNIASTDQMINATVKYFTHKFGPPNKVLTLNDADKWHLIGQVSKNDMIYYIAIEPFLTKDNKHSKQWKASDPYDAFFYWFMDGVNDDFWFSKDKQDVTVYAWIRKNAWKGY
jgi:Tfp pilus assembly protein PilF